MKTYKDVEVYYKGRVRQGEHLGSFEEGKETIDIFDEIISVPTSNVMWTNDFDDYDF